MYENKKLIIFDLDGTLTESKSSLDSEMSGLILKLLLKYEVAVISGGKYRQFKDQFLRYLSGEPYILSRLYLFPTCATAFYKNIVGLWAEIYKEFLLRAEKNHIISTLEKARQVFNLPTETYGPAIEDRETQITLSACGQEAPLEVKSKWDPDQKKRKEIVKYLQNTLNDYEIRIGGTTSIDITRKGIDKAYGISKIEEILGIAKDEMLFIGDALFEGGNDYPVKQTGVDCIGVSGPEECKKIIRNLIGVNE